MKKKHGSSRLQMCRVSTCLNFFVHREKHLLISGDNYGRDLPSVQNLLKKQQHFESELDGHEFKVQLLLSGGTELEVSIATAASEIKVRCGRLQQLWTDLSEASKKRWVAT